MKVYIYFLDSPYFTARMEKRKVWDGVQYQNDIEMTSIRFQRAKRGNFYIISTMGPNIELPYVSFVNLFYLVSIDHFNLISTLQIMLKWRHINLIKTLFEYRFRSKINIISMSFWYYIDFISTLLWYRV